MTTKTETAPDALTADAILAIPLYEPERLFRNPEALRADWQMLLERWHPDRNRSDARASEVVQHINALRAAARRKQSDGEWQEPGVLRITATDGRQYKLRFRRRTAFELGETFIGDRVIAYAVDAANADLFDAGLVRINALDFRDEAMRAEMKGRLPGIEASIETPARRFLILRKDPDFVSLADLVRHLGGKLDPRHVAWVVSGLESIACYLDWAGLMHGAISLETVFVSARGHAVMLPGGWWYATSFRKRIEALPERTAWLLPTAAPTPRLANGNADLLAIRQTAREMLGEDDGGLLMRNASVPEPLLRWLVEPPREAAVADYQAGETAREAAFGPRAFTDLPVDPADLYDPS